MTKDEMQKVRDIISNFDRWEAKDLLQAVAILDAALAAPEPLSTAHHESCWCNECYARKFVEENRQAAPQDQAKDAEAE